MNDSVVNLKDRYFKIFMLFVLDYLAGLIYLKTSLSILFSLPQCGQNIFFFG